MAKRRINRLNIWMNGEYVGYWTKKSGVEELYYDNTWVENESGRPLSLSLPFTPGNQKIRGDNVKFYFDNLLPDSTDIRERLAQKFNSNSTSPFDLLVQLGKDCAGSIQLLAPDEDPINIENITFRTLTETNVADILRRTVSANPMGQNDAYGDLRISLAGAQEKTALLWHNGRWCEPEGSTPTTHIFKLPLGLIGNMKADMSESVENEWLCSKIVAAFGLPVARCDLATFEDQKVLIVKRFDRKYAANKNWIIRLPQEDFCQAKAISPLYKYQKDGGPGIADCIKILDGASEPAMDRQTFFKAQIIFWLLFATDGHSKNFSIRHLSRDAYELTPLYDILSIHPLIGPKNNQIPVQRAKMAMAIRASKNYYLIQKIQRRHFISQARAVGISETDVNDMIDTIVDATEAIAQKIYDMLPDSFPQRLADTVLQGMQSQARKLRE